MSKWRIDFSVREAGVPEEDARGIRFGDEVELDQVYGFFDRCRDAVRALLNAGKPNHKPVNITVDQGMPGTGNARASVPHIVPLTPGDKRTWAKERFGGGYDPF